MTTPGTAQIMQAARRTNTVIPAFNIPHIPMMEAIVHALADARCFGLIAVARLEWQKFEAGSLEAVFNEYRRCKDERFTRLHLDHVPVIDEDHQRVDYKAIISEALTLGYDSVMVDGSRLELADNIEATQEVTVLAHEAGVPIEAELGAVLGHEQGPLPPYEELFASGKGFTDVDEAVTFARETNIDWLSVAVGNIHGAVSAAKKNEKKITARIDIDHLDAIHRAVGIPLVLHGGSGIATTFIREAIRHGITKINVGTAVRQPYEQLRETSVARAQEAVYATVTQVLNDELDIAGSADLISSAQ